MTQRFHIGTVGPAPCSAGKVSCPFGGDSGVDNHFDTFEEAALEYEKKNQKNNFRSLSKDSNVDFATTDDAITAAMKPDVSRSTLIALSKHEDPAVRRAVASSSKTTVSLLRRLAKDKDEETRAAVAYHTNTPEEILTKLSEDKSNLVVSFAVQNPNTPKSAIDKVDIDNNLSVALAVSNNDHGNVSVRMFKKLSKIDDNEIQTRLASNSKAPDTVVAQSIIGLRQANALMELHPNPPAEAVEKAWSIHTANGRKPSEIDLYISNDSTPSSVLKSINNIESKAS